ncbi:MAG: hypothetical protein GY895_14250 [Phycisphaera sp.]|nr:hypothetical protein [Phycisphaera sp.]
MLNEAIQGTTRGRLATVLLAIAIPFCLGIGLVGQVGSLALLREVRMLERLPNTPLEAAIPGPILAHGKAVPLAGSPDGDTITSRWSRTTSLWVRATEEVEKKDSKGHTHWHTVSDQTDFVDFQLVDDSGSIEIIPDHGITPYIAVSSQTGGNGRRFTEYRIDPGSAIRIVGMVTDHDGATAITFDRPGEYLPILSDRPIRSIRSGIGFGSTLLIVLSVVGISGGCVAFMLFFKLQNTLGFVLSLGVMETAILLVGGYIMLSQDLQAAHHSLATSEEAAREILKSDFNQLGIEWNGTWQDDAAFTRAGTAASPGPRTVMIRENLAARVRRTEEIRSRFPQWLVAASIGLPEVPRILDAKTSIEDSKIDAARPFWLMPAIGLVFGGLLGAIGLQYGMRRVQLKRLIENVPVTPCDEVEIGVTEVIGRVENLDPKDAERLAGPLTGKDCVWFDYHVQEWRGSGKNRHLHTIERTKEHVRFHCKDDSGHIPIHLEGARIINGRSAVKKSGNRVYTEKSLREGDPLYVLGSGEIDPSTGDSLMIRQDPDGLPYLVSNLPESRIKTRQITAGFWLLALGMSSITSVVLFTTSFLGTASAMAQLLAAMGSIILVSMLVLIILYNDLVFLQQRVRTAHANIDVALKKRLELVPNLQEVAKGYAAHESETQRLVAGLRASLAADPSKDREEDASTNTAIRRLLAVRESYPDLKADMVFADLMRRLTTVENEITARRRGFNATVERYRSRIHTLPEAIIARTFGFRDVAFLKWDAKMIALQEFDLSAPIVQETDPTSDATAGEEPPSPPSASN